MTWRLLLAFMLGMSLSASATQQTSAQRLAELVDADHQFAGKSNPE
jgi:hypothetical protein